MRIIDYVLYFFFYSFVGWFFESCYCSWRPKKWINRGFLRGPLCPIYGTGTIVMMVTLIPLRSLTEHMYLNELIIFIAGMVVCDTVEFITSYLMEKLFNARWWDYSGMKFNIQGRICLTHTLYWGTGACIFTFVLHPIIDNFIISQVNPVSRSIIVYIILVVFAADLVDTVINALGIRKISTKFRTLSDDIAAFAVTAYSSVEAKVGQFSDESKAELESNLNELRTRYEDMKLDTQNLKTRTQKRLFRVYPYIREGAARQQAMLEDLLNDLKSKITNKQNKK